MGILALLILQPLLSSFCILMLQKLRVGFLRCLSLGLALIHVGLLGYLYLLFSPIGWQCQEFYPWFPAIKLFFTLGIDGISFAFAAMTILIFPLILLGTWHEEKENPGIFLSLLFMLQSLSLCCFLTTSTIVFYFCLEALLFPLFFLILIWGEQDKKEAAFKFFLYTFISSALLLVAFMLIGMQHSFLISGVTAYILSLSTWQQYFVLFAFLFAFMVKIPVFPFHTWLPDVHANAPTAGSALLAAIILKVGGYGLLRFVIPVIHHICNTTYLSVLIIIGVISIIYTAIVALGQQDIKKLIAYSSITHMGVFFVGSLASSALLPHVSTGIEGGIAQMIAHAFSSAGFFLMIGFLYHLCHTKQIHDYRGLKNDLPGFNFFFLCFALANIGLPGSFSFVGEFLSFIPIVRFNLILGLLTMSTLVLSATYTLYVYKMMFFGVSSKTRAIGTIPLKFRMALYFLLVFIILLGFFPQWLFYNIDVSIMALMKG